MMQCCQHTRGAADSGPSCMRDEVRSCLEVPSMTFLEVSHLVRTTASLETD